MKQFIIKSITIGSFGVFKERTTINLETTKEKPIILVEGMNGCGKTTLLQMLQVGLYGERIYKVSKAKYISFVDSMIRQDAILSPCVILQVLLRNGPCVNEYTITREWRRTSKKLIEDFAVFRDGLETDITSEQWIDIINEYLPSELADLFFFDGEKIESMANPERMPIILRQATEALLGVGEIDSIANDLLALERRTLLKIKNQRKDSAKDSESLKVKLVELNSINDDLSKRIQNRGGLVSRKDELIKEIEQAKIKSDQQGLGAFKRSLELKEKINVLEDRLKDLKEERVKIVSDPLYPLSRQTKLVKSLFEAISAEVGYVGDKNTLEAIKHHDDILSVVLKNKFPDLDKDIDDVFKREYDILVEKLDFPANYHQLDANSYEARIDVLTQRFNDVRDGIDNIQNEVLRIQKDIDQSPAPEKVELLIKNLAVKEEQLDTINKELKKLDEDNKSLYEKRARLDLQVQNLQAGIKRDIGHQERKRYSIEAGERSRGLLELYKKRLIKSKAEWLSSAICNYFTLLLRKKDFIGKVNINPEDFSVDILNTQGENVPVERLSAGERQMLATALLRAIMSAKSAALPIVVDTPLARLDGAHRLNLVKNFYTTVSHQVLILSTDEEISGDLRKAISPFSSRTYRLTFNEAERATYVTED